MSRRASSIVVLLTLALAVLPVSVQAQGTGRITGTVRDSAGSRALPEAQVTVTGTRFRGITDADGGYSIANVPAGTYASRATSGYREARSKCHRDDGCTATARIHAV